MVAEQLQESQARITIIESDEARSEALARFLPKVLVLRGDGTDLELLEQERIEDADVLVAVTNDDSKKPAHLTPRQATRYPQSHH